MRIILYVFADVLFVLTAVFPVVTVCCIRSYLKQRNRKKPKTPQKTPAAL